MDERDHHVDAMPTNESLDPERFRTFYDELLPVVYGFLLRRTGGREDVAMDLTQETFLAGVRALRAGVQVDEPRAWLMTIARRRLVDFYRRLGVRRAVSIPVDPRLIPGWGDSEVEARVVAAFESLPAHYRDVLLLRYVDDLPLDVVAGLIEKTPAATESMLARARAALSDAYGHDDG
jgi:RNA polymerase sigma-70 factor, ECF subfamily